MVTHRRGPGDGEEAQEEIGKVGAPILKRTKGGLRASWGGGSWGLGSAWKFIVMVILLILGLPHSHFGIEDLAEQRAEVFRETRFPRAVGSSRTNAPGGQGRWRCQNSVQQLFHSGGGGGFSK